MHDDTAPDEDLAAALDDLDQHLAPLLRARDALAAARDTLAAQRALVEHLQHERVVAAIVRAAHPNPEQPTWHAPRRRRSSPAPQYTAADLFHRPAIPAQRSPEDDRVRAVRPRGDLPPPRR